ncbi:MAG: PQQ-dependent sugar dehydrogenase [Gammaproteobacteria bacterium]|nr:PQQ-dependent sugar dehydrogenase [Gammaproteobacteria bacterium]
MRQIFIVLIISFNTVVMAADVVSGSGGRTLSVRDIASFASPWAIEMLDAGRLLVTEKSGQLWTVRGSGEKTAIDGLPKIYVGGQGGLGDVVLHPNFEANRWVYLSFVDSPDGGRTRYAHVVRARLILDDRPRLEGLESIWRQMPATQGEGHFSHRIAFGPAGSAQAGMLFITSGDRQLQWPAQDMEMAQGKIIRLHDDGAVPVDNPFQDQGTLARTFWSVGHRNMLGMAFDSRGVLWAHEMGPRHGDELNRITAGANYGWPEVSEGNHYSGVPIPPHSSQPQFVAPIQFWVPTIAPSGMTIDGDTMFIGGLRSQALIKLRINGDVAQELERFEMGRRIRDVQFDAKGGLWFIEDGRSARLRYVEAPR